MEELVDAFLYLGPNRLAMKEPLPAYIVLDADYMAEVQRREAVLGRAIGTQKEFYQQFVNDAENLLFTLPKPPDAREVQGNVQNCLNELKKHGHAQ